MIVDKLLRMREPRNHSLKSALVFTKWNLLLGDAEHLVRAVKISSALGRSGSASVELVSLGNIGFSCREEQTNAWAFYVVEDHTVHDSGVVSDRILRYCHWDSAFPSTEDGVQKARTCVSAARRLISDLIAVDHEKFPSTEALTAAYSKTPGRIYDDCDFRKRIDEAALGRQPLSTVQFPPSSLSSNGRTLFWVKLLSACGTDEIVGLHAANRADR